MTKTSTIFLLALLLSPLVTLACSGADTGSLPIDGETTVTSDEPEAYVIKQSLDFTMTLTTTSVGGRYGRLDEIHSCEGLVETDTSPHLKWEGIPDGAKSLALVMDDPASDVHGLMVDVLWTHWVVYSIPTEITELAVGQVAGDLLANGAKQGVNDFKLVQYNGPCPIPTLGFPRISHGVGSGGNRLKQPNLTAEDRAYYFRLYAVDIPVDLPSGAERGSLLEAIDGHILAAGELAVQYRSTKRVSCSMDSALTCIGEPTGKGWYPLQASLGGGGSTKNPVPVQ